MSEDLESRKQVAEKQLRDTLQSLDNLDEEEIAELVNFEIHARPSSIDDQVKLYYLKLKSEEPKKAEEMQGEIGPIIQKGIASQADVEDLCFALCKHLSGFSINFDGHSYSVRNSKLNIDGKEVE